MTYFICLDSTLTLEKILEIRLVNHLRVNQNTAVSWLNRFSAGTVLIRQNLTAVDVKGGGPRVVFLPHPRVKVSIVGSLRDQEVACSASDRQGSNFESCVWRTVSSHHPQEVLLAQFRLYVHKGGLKPDSFHFHFLVDVKF